MRIQNKITGFTLIELVVVIALVSVIAVIASTLLSAGLHAYIQAQRLTDADWQARVAMEIMAREIRNIRSSADITTSTAAQLSFVDVFGNSVNYTLSGTTLLENSNILADGIGGLTFTYYNNALAATNTPSAIIAVQVNLTVTQNNTSNPLQVILFPRNVGVAGS
ncbi:MAG: type II secretion system protein [Pseudomonadota bacterium]